MCQLVLNNGETNLLVGTSIERGLLFEVLRAHQSHGGAFRGLSWAVNQRRIELLRRQTFAETQTRNHH